jgi:dihydrofolate synthase/folylpolyglutamate synthase
MDFLGPTREEIGFEKAGIFRPGKAAVCGDMQPPQTLLIQCEKVGADMQLQGRDFGYQRQDQQWQYWGRKGKRSGLAFPALRGNNQLSNASVALAALDSLHDVLPVAMQDIRRGLAEVELTGRFQVLPGRPTVVLDVAHNPQAARILAGNLGDMAFSPDTWGVFGMLRDKDIPAVVAPLLGRVTRWLPCSLEGPRAASAEDLTLALREAGVSTDLPGFPTPGAALSYALEQAGEVDRILVFGSFLTVADALRVLQRDVLYSWPKTTLLPTPALI